MKQPLEFKAESFQPKLFFVIKKIRFFSAIVFISLVFHFINRLTDSQTDLKTDLQTK